MTINLLALCGESGEPIVKRVRTSAPVQQKLTGFFEALEIKFREGVEVERPYESKWTPSSEELITLPINAETNSISLRLQAGVLALDELDGAAFENERVRALAVEQGTGANSKLLIQVFSLNQRLSRKMAFIANNNIFDLIDTSAFTLSN